MTCKCGSNRLAFISGKVSDLSICRFPSNEDRIGAGEIEGYMPSIEGVCSGDYIELELCLDCGQVQRDWPFTEEEVKEVLSRWEA